ncbi:transporter substrate-binding domain-containing protein [Pelagibacterium lacus]|uniref:ABC transporter substrate-binding protein n=1 Tax=Pelagibacterium lacus TaxID=2282655 RepID=A0A369W4M6_9HYPH|nr:transporter substrate-binding domain-containing protein [Pelagibacterium lacus]RDE09508.1 ABC transporter substrate-binding protein [Pelagibacterium lacus]
MNNYLDSSPHGSFAGGRILGFLIILLGLLICGSTHAQEGGEAGPLRVGVYVSPPFVDTVGETAYTGMAIDLWTQIAQRLGVTFEYEEYPTFRHLLQATADGTVDAAVTNLTITHNRAEVVSFTQPWYDAGLRLMVPEEGGASGWDVISGLGDAGHLRAYAWLAIVILLATLGLTLFDRKFDPDFPKRWREGVAESFHHVMSIATSGKTARKNLFGWVGRIWQALWLVVGVAVIAYVTSSVTSVMTTVSLTRGINSLSDMSDKTAAVFTGSVAEDYMRELGLSARAYDNIALSVAALEAGEVDAIVGDAPILEHYVLNNPQDQLAVVGNIFHPDKYGFAFPLGSELTRAVTLEILAAQESGALEALKQRYFGSGQ